MVIDTVKFYGHAVDQQRMILRNTDFPQARFQPDDLAVSLQNNRIKEGLFRIPQNRILGCVSQLSFHFIFVQCHAALADAHMGAALQAGVLTGDVKDILLLDVTPLSLGIETMGGVFTRLIDRNTTIPTRKSQIFSTAADGQTSVEVHVLQGEREMAAYNKTLGRFQLGGIAPAPRGVPQIEVTFDIDANGIVKVSAKDLGTGKEANISITASTNLSQEDIDKAVREAEQFAAEDKAKKEEVDTHNMADQTVYQTEKTLGELGDKIDAADKADVQAAIDKLKETVKTNDTEAIKADTDALQKAFYPIAEKIYKEQQSAQGEPQADGDGNVYGADFEDKT